MGDLFGTNRTKKCVRKWTSQERVSVDTLYRRYRRYFTHTHTHTHTHHPHSFFTFSLSNTFVDIVEKVRKENGNVGGWGRHPNCVRKWKSEERVGCLPQLFGTNRTKKCVRKWKSEERVSTVWMSTPAPHVSIHMCSVTRLCVRSDSLKWNALHLEVHPHYNESLCAHKRVTLHIWMSHVAHMNESRRTYEWVTSHIHMTHESFTSHMWMKYI